MSTGSKVPIVEKTPCNFPHRKVTFQQ